MRSPLRVAAIVFAAAAATVVPGTARSQDQAILSCPSTASGPFVAEVTFTVGSTPLGAYSTGIMYDSGVLAVAGHCVTTMATLCGDNSQCPTGERCVPMVTGGTTAEFSTSPTANIVAAGSLRIAGLQNMSLSGPSGTVSVAKITFNPVGTSSSTDIMLSGATLFDTSANSFASQLSTDCLVTITGGPATTTSTTIAPSPTTTSTTAAATTTSTTTTTAARPTTTSSTAARTTTTSSTTPSTTTTSSTTTPGPTTTSASTTTTRASVTTSSSTSTTRASTTTVSTSTTASTTSTRPTATTSSTTTTLPSGILPQLEAIDSALGALIGEVNAEHISTDLRSVLLRQLRHAQTDVALTAEFLAQGRDRQAKIALEHAARWLISFRFRVGSLGGRRGGADRNRLLPIADSILNELRSVRRSF